VENWVEGIEFLLKGCVLEVISGWTKDTRPPDTRTDFINEGFGF
jgi:hypothetical protein